MENKKFDSDRKPNETEREYARRLQSEISEMRQKANAIAIEALKEIADKEKITETVNDQKTA